MNLNNLNNLWASTNRYDHSKKSWYIEANTYLNEMACHFDMPIEKVIGIVSALSPGCPWKQNVIDTYRFIKSDGKYDRCVTYRPQVRKALHILRLKKHFEKIPTILNGPKTTAFYQALLNPTKYSMPVIDVHIIRAFLGQPDIDRGNKIVKYYLQPNHQHIIADGIEKIAVNNSLNVHSCQAILWSAWKRITDNKTYSNGMPIWNSLVNEIYQQQTLFQ